jgi:hypothetical protein
MATTSGTLLLLGHWFNIPSRVRPARHKKKDRHFYFSNLDVSAADAGSHDHSRFKTLNPV